MKKFEKILKDGDLRTIGKVNQAIDEVKDQQGFDDLFRGLYSNDRKVVMRTADAIEKITLFNTAFIIKHKNEILQFCKTAKEKELKWHLALLVPRLPLNKKETGQIWNLLTTWVNDKTESKIVRVNSLQALSDILQSHTELSRDFNWIISKIETENIPSLQARIRKLKKEVRIKDLYG